MHGQVCERGDSAVDSAAPRHSPQRVRGAHTHTGWLPRVLYKYVRLENVWDVSCGMMYAHRKKDLTKLSRRVPAGRWGELRSAEQPDLYLCCRLHV